MPNPLFSMPRNIGRIRNQDNPPNLDPDEDQDSLGPYGPDLITEEVVGQRTGNAYRGLETHGVDPTTQPVHGDAYDPLAGRSVDIWEPPHPYAAPIPVFIVAGEQARQERRWRTYQEAIVGGTEGQKVRRIVSARLATEPGATRRLNLRIKNIDATNTVYIGSDESVNDQNGWPIAPGAQEEFLYAETEVWMAGAAALTLGTVVKVAVRLEYMVEVHD